MTDLNDQFGFERLQRRIDDPHNKAVIVLIVNQDDTIDTAAVGIDNPQAMWEVCFSVTAQLSDEVMAEFTPQQKAGVRLALPTREMVDELGLRRIRRTD